MTDVERIIRLEERLTHLQNHVTEQDRVILGLDEQLRRFKADFAALRARLEAMRLPENEPGEAPEHPPHY